MRIIQRHDLKPCPFCGVVPIIREPSGGEYVIRCENPKCNTAPNVAFETGCSMGGFYVDSIVKRWNTRKGEVSNENDS